MRYQFAISNSPSPGDYVYLFQVNIAAPLNQYLHYQTAQQLGDGGVRLAGWPIDLWYWAFLSESERDFFREYCPNGYAKDIYIRTLNEENKWVNARTTMIWPLDPPQWSNDNILSVSIRFKVKSTALV